MKSANSIIIVDDGAPQKNDFAILFNINAGVFGRLRNALSMSKLHLIAPMMIDISMNEVQRLVRLIVGRKQWHVVLFYSNTKNKSDIFTTYH